MDWCVLSVYKNEHPKGFGALEDCPNKKMRSTYLPEAIHLLDRREVYKTNSGKGCNFSLQLLPTAFLWGVQADKIKLVWLRQVFYFIGLYTKRGVCRLGTAATSGQTGRVLAQAIA